MKRPPFSMKAFRDAQRRAFAAKDGWIKRRITSENVFPFRRRTTGALPAEKQFSKQWGWPEWLTLAIALAGTAAMFAMIIYALG